MSDRLHKIYSSRVYTSANTYVGEAGRLFYDETDGILRLSDGATPGGIIVSLNANANILVAQQARIGENEQIGDWSKYAAEVGFGGPNLDAPLRSIAFNLGDYTSSITGITLWDNQSTDSNAIVAVYGEADYVGNLHVKNIIGGDFEAYNLGGGNISQLVGFSVFTENDNGNVTNAIGLSVGLHYVTPETGNTTNYYGILIQDLISSSQGAANNWAIKTGVGLVEFGDNVKAPMLLPQKIYKAAGTPLPAASASLNGARAVVSDATSPTYMGTYTSGGNITCEVICSFNGSTYSWKTK